MFAGISAAHGQDAFVVIAPIAMIGFGYFIMQKLVFDLVDEVWDDSDALLVKNRGQEQRIALGEIKNASDEARVAALKPGYAPQIVMPALVAGTHVLTAALKQRRGWPEQVRP